MTTAEFLRVGSSRFLRLLPIAKWSFILSLEFSLFLIPPSPPPPPPARALASPSLRRFSFSLVPSLFLPRSSSPFVYLRTDRSLYRRLHIYWRCCLSRNDAWCMRYRVIRKNPNPLSSQVIRSIGLSNKRCSWLHELAINTATKISPASLSESSGSKLTLTRLRSFVSTSL